MQMAENNAYSSSPEPDTKRRKLRKGTKSCWDCKKRKVKCSFDAASDTVCIACRRRGAPCIGQDQPEAEFQAHAEANRDPLLDRIEKVESLLEELLQVRRSVENQSGYFTPTSDYQSLDSFQPPPEPCVATIPANMRMTDESICLPEKLLKAFPSQQDINVFCKSDYIATFYCHQIFTNSGERPEHEAFHFVNELASMPDPSTTPPILVAK